MLVMVMSNNYLGGSAYVAPTKPPAVRLSRSTRPAAWGQKYCATMDLKAKGLTLVHLGRIRIRCVHHVAKEWGGAAKDAITEARVIDLPCHEKCADGAEAATEMRQRCYPYMDVRGLTCRSC